MKLAVIGVGLIGGSFALALKRRARCRTSSASGATAPTSSSRASSASIDTHRAGRRAPRRAMRTSCWSPRRWRSSPAILPTLKDCARRRGHRRAAARSATWSPRRARRSARRIAQFVPGASGRRRREERRRRRERRALPRPPRRAHAAAEKQPAAVERVADAWEACGARITRLDAGGARRRVRGGEPSAARARVRAGARHRDSGRNAEQLFSYAAGGFRDFTRIASSHPEMWRDICVANRDALLDELARYQARSSASCEKLLRGGATAAALEKLFARGARRARPMAEVLDLKPARRARGTVRAAGLQEHLQPRAAARRARAPARPRCTTCSTPTTRG